MLVFLPGSVAPEQKQSGFGEENPLPAGIPRLLGLCLYPSSCGNGSGKTLSLICPASEDNQYLSTPIKAFACFKYL